MAKTKLSTPLNKLPLPNMRRLTNSYLGLGYRVALREVLKQHPNEVGDTQAEVVINRYRRLITTWRRRVWSLGVIGYEPVSSPILRNRMFYCPPAGVFTAGRYTCCKQATFCPFCWCRQHVGTTYRRLEQLLFDDPDSHCTPKNTKLVSIKVDYICSPGVLIEDVLGAIHHRRTAFLAKHLSHGLGGFSLFVVEPRNKADYRWRLTQRVLALLPRDVAAPKSNYQNVWEPVTVTSYKRLTRKTLAVACGTVARYPASMLYEHPAYMLEILQTRKLFGGHRLRCSASYGVFRNDRRLQEKAGRILS